MGKHLYTRAERAEVSARRLQFFSTWSRESAWVLGLIYGDGSVTKEGRVYLFGNADTITKFQMLLNIPSFITAPGGFRAHFDDVALVRWFRARGIKSKKSHTLPWPEDLPDEFRWDFIRGLVDTDGTVAIEDPKGRKRKAKGDRKMNFGYDSASLAFVTRFRDEVGSKRAITRSTKVKDGKEYECFGFNMGARDGVAVLDRVYDCPEAIRNEVRYQVYLEGKCLLAARDAGCIVCAKPIHARGLCTRHMFDGLRSARACEGCGDGIRTVGAAFCSACKYRSLRLLKNPDLRTRVRR